jgi:Ca2+-binding EF-hand superfamily protein
MSDVVDKVENKPKPGNALRWVGIVAAVVGGLVAVLARTGDRIDRAFRAMDGDHDGKLVAAEIESFSAQNNDGAVGARGAAFIVSHFDADGDGALSKEEFRAWLEPLKDAAGSGSPADALFQLSDANGDGQVSFDEANAYFSQFGTSAEDLSGITLFLAAFDADHDRILNRTEFEGFAEISQVAARDPAEAMFQITDKDRNGEVAMEEFAALAELSGEEPDTEGAKAVVAQFDRDGNGTLSAEEFSLFTALISGAQ